MTSPGPQPTDAERETAWRLLHSGGLDSFRADTIAQHLADQRAKYEAVAQELDYYASKTEGGSYSDGMTEAAERIREVARG